MKWYVKFDNERRNEIHGPMSKEEALDKAARLDGMAFSEQIFKPEFVTTEEVDTLLDDLRSMVAGVLPSGYHIPIAERARDALILLSKKKKLRFIVSDEIAKLLFELEETRLALAAMIASRSGRGNLPELLGRAIDAIVSLSREEVRPNTVNAERSKIDRLLIDLVHEAQQPGGSLRDSNSSYVVRRAHTAIVSLFREKVVTGSIEGGVLNLGEVPEGVTVDIRDFDVDGVDPGLLKTDEDGNTYFEVG